MKYPLIPLLFLFYVTSMLPQENITVSFQPGDGKIDIYYELHADAKLEYDVSVALRRSSDASYVYSPSRLTGDIGRGKFGEGKRKVTWALNESESLMFNGEDFFFEVTANPIEVKKGSTWYYWVGGILLCGGTAAVLLMEKKGEESSSTSTSPLPSPPGRP